MRPRLCILARSPELGVGKRRLAASLGDAATLAVYQALLRQLARALPGWPGPMTLFLDGPVEALQDSGLDDLPCQDQAGGSLAQRMQATLGSALSQGPALIIGTDTPLIQAQHLAAMAELLNHHEVAIGPARDGGYWALGLRSPRYLATCCAEDLPWSSSQLLQATQSTLASAGCHPALGPLLMDLDTAEDLHHAQSLGFTLGTPSPSSA